MPRDPRLYIDDILEAISRIREYVKGQDERSFSCDLKTQDAVIRNLEIIGEAAGKLPEVTDIEASDVDWRKIRGLRNILAHEYFGVNLPIVWDIVENKLEPLEQAVRRLLQDSDR
jgi:uncharacterized protein with HEPN domain